MFRYVENVSGFVGRPFAVKLPLSFACWNYDRVSGLFDGSIQPKGIDLRRVSANCCTQGHTALGHSGVGAHDADDGARLLAVWYRAESSDIDGGCSVQL